jgi:hypothetical protein
LILTGGSASRAQYFDWAVGFGGLGNTIETADKIHVDDLGPDTFLLGANDQNVFVAEYTSDGDLFWVVRFGGAPGARGWSAIDAMRLRRSSSSVPKSSTRRGRSLRARANSVRAESQFEK